MPEYLPEPNEPKTQTESSCDGGSGRPPKRTAVGTGDGKDRNVATLAQEEARRFGHNYVGSEFILLGLIAGETSIAARALELAGINLTDARVEVEKFTGLGSGCTTREIPFAPTARRIIEKSWAIARDFDHKYIGTEHLLLALLREDQCDGCRVLESLGIDKGKIRQNVLELLKEKNALMDRI